MKNIIIIILIVAGIGTYKYLNRSKTITIDSTLHPEGTLSLKYGYEFKGKKSSLMELKEPLPLLIVLHDKGESSQELYNGLLSKIKDRYRFLLMTSPYAGIKVFGWSKAPEEFLESGQKLHLAIQELTKSVGLKGKPTLIGHGSGASMAYYLATEYGLDYSHVFALGGLLDLSYLTGKRDLLDKKQYTRIFSYFGTNPQDVHIEAEKLVIHIRRKHFNIDLVDINGPLGEIFQAQNDVLIDEIMMRISEN